MFEIIGIITVSLIVLFFLILQYFMVSFKDYRNFVDYFVALFPLLPFIVMFLLTVYYLLEIMYYKFKRWFEMKWGWFFINGKKRERWAEYLRDKYDE